MVRLGNLLAQHEGDDDTTLAVARRWFERAAHADPPHPDGLYNLATMLFEGARPSALLADTRLASSPQSLPLAPPGTPCSQDGAARRIGRKP